LRFESFQFPLLGIFPWTARERGEILVSFDEEILKADMHSETPLKYASQSIGVVAIQKLGEKLLEDKQARA